MHLHKLSHIIPQEAWLLAEIRASCSHIGSEVAETELPGINSMGHTACYSVVNLGGQGLCHKPQGWLVSLCGQACSTCALKYAGTMLTKRLQLMPEGSLN